MQVPTARNASNLLAVFLKALRTPLATETHHQQRKEAK
jgi:hypothetical protein